MASRGGIGGRLAAILALVSTAIPAAARAAEGGNEDFFAAWARVADEARESQPHWSSPLVTTTGLLEQRLRFDMQRQHAGNGIGTTAIDGGRGLDLIVSPTNEVQVGAVPYFLRTGPQNTPRSTGFADWPMLRVEQRLAASPDTAGNYVLTAWLAVQAPIGVERYTSNAWTWQPTLAFGKGWGRFDIQGTVGGVLPASHSATVGNQIQTNVALQYHLGEIFWPEVEANWTYWAGGQRVGLSQVFFTTGLVVGRLQVFEHASLTLGVGYQTALTPDFRARPLTPAYDHAWLFTSRLNF